jgi:hypothetical protein
MISSDDFTVEIERLGFDNGYMTLAELITVIVREREELTADNALTAARAMPWDEAWDNIVGPALDRLTDMLVDHGAIRTEI